MVEIGWADEGGGAGDPDGPRRLTERVRRPKKPDVFRVREELARVRGKLEAEGLVVTEEGAPWWIESGLLLDKWR